MMLSIACVILPIAHIIFLEFMDLHIWSPYMITLLDKRRDVICAEKCLFLHNFFTISWLLFVSLTSSFSSYFFIFSLSLTQNSVKFITNTHKNFVMTICHQHSFFHSIPLNSSLSAANIWLCTRFYNLCSEMIRVFDKRKKKLTQLNHCSCIFLIFKILLRMLTIFYSLRLVK